MDTEVPAALQCCRLTLETIVEAIGAKYRPDNVSIGLSSTCDYFTACMAYGFDTFVFISMRGQSLHITLNDFSSGHAHHNTMDVADPALLDNIFRIYDHIGM